MALARIEDIKIKISQLQSMRATLTHLARECHGDDMPDCPIFDDLVGSFGAQKHVSGKVSSNS